MRVQPQELPLHRRRVLLRSGPERFSVTQLEARAGSASNEAADGMPFKQESGCAL